MEKRYRIDIPLPKEVQLALDELSKRGYRAFVVGGAVRDSLLGKAAHDFDIASPSSPGQTISCFPGFDISRSGIKHGTVRVIIHHYPVEITTFRTEGSYRDHRHPDSVSFTSSAEEDSKRRDFTINGLYYRDGEVYDFHGGLEDLSSGVVRAIGDPIERFQEDALRILRGLRFSCQLGFAIEERTRDAMAECAHLLGEISEERIEAEMIRLASYPSFYDLIRENSAVFLSAIPMLPPAFISRLTKEACDDPYANIAGIFEAGRISPDLAYEMLMRLKFSRSSAQAIQSLLDIDRSFTLKDVESPKRFRLLLLESFPLNPEVTIRFLCLRDAIEGRDISGYRQLREQSEDVEFTSSIPSSLSDLKVTGHDLQRIGYKPGPIFHEVLKELLLQVNQQNIPNERKAQLEWLKRRAR